MRSVKSAHATLYGLLLLLVPVVARAQTWTEIVKLTASDAEAGEEFGFSTAVSGDTVVVGVHLEDSEGTNAGAAYVFERDQGGPDNWGMVKKLLASDAAAFDEFGISVTISGDTVIVGSYADDIDGNVDAGSAYVFQRNQGGPNNWGEVKQLMGLAGAFSENFGASVALDGDTAIIGAIDAANDLDIPSGAVYIFERNEGGANNWGEIIRLTSSDGENFDLFGAAVDISGDTVIVGSHQSDDACPPVPVCNSGAAYIFERDEGGVDNWGEVKKLIATDLAMGAHFGFSVTISGDTAVMGSYRDSGVASESGAAYVFERNLGGTDNWGQLKKLIASDATAVDQFGYSVALSGNTLIVGTWLDDDSGFSSGAAYVFGRQAGGPNNWGEVTKLGASDAVAEDRFGVSVGIDGDRAVVGTHRADDACPADPQCNSGAVYVFDSNLIFGDGFESGDLTAWSMVQP